MSDLTGRNPANSYKDLMQVSNGNNGIDATLRDVEDGEGTVSPLQLSSNFVNINGVGKFKMAGVAITATGAEINYLSGVSSGIQAQINAKVAKSGDIMTGALTIAALVNAINSADYPVQIQSGVSDGVSAVGHSFDTLNTLSNASARIFSIKNNGDERINLSPDYLTIKDNLALGEASGSPFTILNAESTPQGLPFGTVAAVIKLKVNVDNGIIALPTAMFGHSVINDGHSNVIPVTFRSEIEQNSNTSFALAYGYYSVLRSNSGKIGGSGTNYQYYAAEPQLSGTGTFGNMIGFNAANQGNAKVTTATGVHINKQFNSTNNYGLVLNGDGIGADTVYGVGRDAQIYFDGVDFVYNSQRVGSGDHKFIGGNVYVVNDVGVGVASPTARMHLAAGTAAAGTASLKLTSGTLLATPEEGAMEYVDGHWHVTNAQRTVLVRSDGVKSSTTTVTNTITETAVYSYTFPVNALHADERIVFTMNGDYSNASSSNDFTIRFKINGVTHETVSRVSGNATDQGWEASFDNTIRTDGASGTFVHFTKYDDTDTQDMKAQTTPEAIDTTIANTFEVTVQWDNADVGNIFNCAQADLQFRH